jgi:amino acid adenylation domain-containing protein
MSRCRPMTAAPELPIDFGGPTDQPFEPIPLSALEGSVPDRFDAVARRFADRPAIEDLDRRLTYEELAALVRRIAAGIERSAGGREGPVAVLLRNDASFPAALLGVLKAGRTVAPLDADHPIERNALIARHAGVAAVVSGGELVGPARRLFSEEPSIIDLEALEDAPAGFEPPRAGPDDLAFLLYTSGSSGAPKGVCHSHRNALNDTLLATLIGHFGPEDRMSMFYSAVIGGIRNILGALLNGACLHVLPPLELGAQGLVREIKARRITTCLSVPTLFRRIAGAVEPGDRLDSVRLVRLAGDRVEWSDVELFRRVFAPGAHLNVAIGSTECSSTYAHWFIGAKARPDGGRLPVGRPLPGLSLSIQGPDGQPVPGGEVGEFVVAGRCLALGYWNDPGQTRRVFTHDPDDPRVSIFRTGDMGLRRPDGLLEFVGRKDQLVKLRGHRIEPAEVETALRSCDGVADAAVVVRRWEDGRPRSLAGYVELIPGVKGLLPRHVRAMMEQHVPRYMVPASLFVVEALPRLANFKLDRVALSRLDDQRNIPAGAGAPEILVGEVAAVFEQIVGVSGATPEDNLLSLGGDSLQAVDVMLELQDRTGVAIPSEVFAQSQTIRELAVWIGSQRQGADGRPADASDMAR